jgi:L-amino acid N-acyltransferase YncA
MLMAKPALRIRPATAPDGAACADIYAPYVTGTCISFEAEPPTPPQFSQRIADAQASHEWLVVELDRGIVGYAYGHELHARAAYGWSCETSIYLARDLRRQGIGRALYAVLLARLAERGYRRALACITLPNEASVGLHRAFGFEDGGRFRGVGWKFDAWHDVAWMQRDLQSVEIDPPAPISPHVPQPLSATEPGASADK